MAEIKSNSHCPICNKNTKEDSRYLNAVCPECAEQVTDEQGRRLLLYNESVSGGFRAIVQGTNELRASHLCYIQGVECWADTAYMGGIVIMPLRKGHEKF